jgi:hypothetical protein
MSGFENCSFGANSSKKIYSEVRHPKTPGCGGIAEFPTRICSAFTYIRSAKYGWMFNCACDLSNSCSVMHIASNIIILIQYKNQK